MEAANSLSPHPSTHTWLVLGFPLPRLASQKDEIGPAGVQALPQHWFAGAAPGYHAPGQQ